MLKVIKYGCIGLLLITVAYESALFMLAVAAESKAKKIDNVISKIKLERATKDSVLSLLQSQGLDVRIDSNPCSNLAGSCEMISVGTINYPSQYASSKAVEYQTPPKPFLSLVQPAWYQTTFYFSNGVLYSTSSLFHVGPTKVGSSRYIENQAKTIFKSSTWTYTKGGVVIVISSLSAGNISDAPRPIFDFKYMYSTKCIDARKLWPSAPAPTEELHSELGC